MPEVTIRLARQEDCPDIAELFLISSDGLAEYIWSKYADEGEELVAVGARRYARECVAFSFENCLMAEVDGQVAGMIHSFVNERDPEATAETDPVLRPYAELEDFGSLYISGVALFPAFRGRGIGSRLMEAAEAKAKDFGLPRLSLIVFGRNEGAYRLYKRLGFEELDRRPLYPHPSLHYKDGDAVLMVRPTR